MALFKILDKYRSAFALGPEDTQLVKEAAGERGYALYSTDYRTVYFPTTNVYSKDGEEAEELKMNAQYTFETLVGPLNFGRAFAVLNPVIVQLFRDVEYMTVLDPGEQLVLTGKAKRNITLEELTEAAPWLFKTFIMET